MTDKVKEDMLLQYIFQICLQEKDENSTRVYLKSYAKELEEHGEELHLLVSNIYFFLLHKIAYLYTEKKNCLNYLCCCSCRALDKSFYKKLDFDNKYTDYLINEIFDQIINVVIIFLENFDVFPCNVTISYAERYDIFFDFLKGSCTPRFLKGLLATIEQNDREYVEEKEQEGESKPDENGKQLIRFFKPIIELILKKLFSRNLVFPQNDVALLLKFLTGFKSVADLIMRTDCIFLHINVENRMKDNFSEEREKEGSRTKPVNIISTGYRERSTITNAANAAAPNTTNSTLNNTVAGATNNIGFLNEIPAGPNVNLFWYDAFNPRGRFSLNVGGLLTRENNSGNNPVDNINRGNVSRSNTSGAAYAYRRRNEGRSTRYSSDKEISGCGYILQCNSLLGMLLSPTVLTMPNITNREEIPMYKHFYNSTTNSLKKMTLGQLVNIYVLLRNDLDWVLENCAEIFKNLLKGSNESKKKILLWISCVLLSNEKKTKLMYNFTSYPQSLDDSYGIFLKILGESSYGFCLNLFWVLLYLCEPITVNKINDMDFFFFLRDDPFSKFILKNITNQPSFEEKENVEKIKKKIKNTDAYKKEPKFITCIFWMTFKAMGVFLKPALDEFIRITQGVENAKNKNLYYMNVHVWKIFLYNTRFIQLLFKFLHLAMSYFLQVVYLFDVNGNVNNTMQTFLADHKNHLPSLVLKCCPPPNEKYFGKLKHTVDISERGNAGGRGGENTSEEKGKHAIDSNNNTPSADTNDNALNNTSDNNVNAADNTHNTNNNNTAFPNGISNPSSGLNMEGRADEFEFENIDRLHASPQFSIIPSFFLGDIFEIIYLLYDLDHIFKNLSRSENFITYLDMELFIAFSVFTMLSEKHVKSVHLRCESAPRTFSFLYKLGYLKKFIEECDLTKKYIIKSFTNIFIASQKGAYTERIQTRVRIVENFNAFFLNKTYVNQFTQIVINNNNLFVHLIHLLLNDVSFLVEEVVTYLSEIKRREDKKEEETIAANATGTNRNNTSTHTNIAATTTATSNTSTRTSRNNNNSINNNSTANESTSENAVTAGSVTNDTRNSNTNANTNANTNSSANSSNNNVMNIMGGVSSINENENLGVDGSLSETSEIEDPGVETEIENESMRNLAAKTKMIISYCFKSCIFLNLLCKNYSTNIVTSNTILAQIVTCLNCYFDYLVGPKCLNIKVKNMEQYNFRPHLWLTSIVESYLFLLNAGKEYEELLIREIANEGRYYKPEIFNKAYYICKREMLLHKEELNKFKSFCQQIVDMKDEVELFEDVSDIPDEFLDPIIQDIMLDPVLLPTSGIVIDRKNIERHLMSEPNDPFNRAPLTKEQLVPQPELKERINKYIDQVRKEKKEKKRLELEKERELELQMEMEIEKGIVAKDVFAEVKRETSAPKDKTEEGETNIEN